MCDQVKQVMLRQFISECNQCETGKTPVCQIGHESLELKKHIENEAFHQTSPLHVSNDSLSNETFIITNEPPIATQDTPSWFASTVTDSSAERFVHDISLSSYLFARVFIILNLGQMNKT